MTNISDTDFSISKDDRIAMAEAYRVYEILEPQEKMKVPPYFVNSLLKFADLSVVPPFEEKDSFSIDKLTQKGKYIVMYMCTFN